LLRRSHPVRPDKKPAIKGWQSVGQKAVVALAKKFPNENIGVVDGDVITRVDIDNPKLIDGAIQKFGDTPIRVHTPSGGMHLWYQANGERRKIKLDGQEIDVLGKGGYGIVPPSETPAGIYEFVSGSLADMDRLPKIKSGVLARLEHHVPNPIGEGNRTNVLFRELRSIALQCETHDELLFRGTGINETMMAPR
jgi:hypothetical protein